VDLHEEELEKYGKEFEFYRYDGASHGFFYYFAPMYRPEATMDAWGKIFTFFGQHLTA
jgi:carboxymethylenebutenolidase